MWDHIYLFWVEEGFAKRFLTISLQGAVLVNDQDPTIYCRVFKIRVHYCLKLPVVALLCCFLDCLGMPSCHDFVRHADLSQVVDLHHYVTLWLYHDPNHLA